MTGGIPIARVFGVELRVHWSWIVILALVAALTVAEVQFAAPDLEPVVQWVVGGLVAAGFLASAAAHDLGHAVVSRRRGIPVESLSVSFFGGSPPYDRPARTAADEAAIAAAGPVVSLVVGLALVAVSVGVSLVGGETVQALAIFGLVLGVLNLILGAVNFVPAYPLDGGRLVRALVWARTGDHRRGSRVVVRIGALIGIVLLAAGFALVVYDDLGNGVMVMLCGWFLRLTARGAQQRVELEELADGLRAGDVMEPVQGLVSPGLTVDTFAEQILDAEPARSAVLVGRGAEVIGIVGVSQLRRLRRSAWPTTRVEDVMVPIDRMPPVSPDAPIWPAFLELREAGLDGVPVRGAEGLEPAGLLTVRSIAAALQARRRPSRPGFRVLP